MTPPLLSVRDLQVEYRLSGTWPWSRPQRLRAVDGVSFDIAPGQTLGVVGESGCGKSTLARALINLVPARSGQICWHGQDLRGAPPAQWQQLRRRVQMIFQDPLAALNPRMTVGRILAEPLQTHCPELSRDQVQHKVRAMLARVGLGEQHLNRYAHEFSGGQCQRIGIARALILEPELVICDEPVSALDVSIRAQIVNLLQELQAQTGMALLFVAHDLALVRHISQRVLVMYLGRAMELADTQRLYTQPQHPYTQALLAAIPSPDPSAQRRQSVALLPGELPSPLAPPSGCSLHTRCPRAEPACSTQVPRWRCAPNGAPDVWVACDRLV